MCVLWPLRKFAKPFEPIKIDPISGCDALPEGPSQASNQAGVVKRGGSCTFLKKALNVYHAGYGMTLVLSNTSHPLTMVCSESEEEKARQLQIPVIMIAAEDGAKLIKVETPTDLWGGRESWASLYFGILDGFVLFLVLYWIQEIDEGADVQVLVWKESISYQIDGSALILWTIALGTVICGAWFAAMEERSSVYVRSQDSGSEKSRSVSIVAESDQVYRRIVFFSPFQGDNLD